MSGDFESWNNSPSQHTAPKQEKTLQQIRYQRERRAKLFVIVGWIVGITLLGLWIWYVSHP